MQYPRWEIVSEIQIQALSSCLRFDALCWGMMLPYHRQPLPHCLIPLLWLQVLVGQIWNSWVWSWVLARDMYILETL